MDSRIEREAKKAFEQGERAWGFMQGNIFEAFILRRSRLLGLRESVVASNFNRELDYYSRGFRRLSESVNSSRSEPVIDAACLSVAVGAIAAAVLLHNKILR